MRHNSFRRLADDSEARVRSMSSIARSMARREILEFLDCQLSALITSLPI